MSYLLNIFESFFLLLKFMTFKPWYSICINKNLTSAIFLQIIYLSFSFLIVLILSKIYLTIIIPIFSFSVISVLFINMPNKTDLSRDITLMFYWVHVYFILFREEFCLNAVFTRRPAILHKQELLSISIFIDTDKWCIVQYSLIENSDSRKW